MKSHTFKVPLLLSTFFAFVSPQRRNGDLCSRGGFFRVQEDCTRFFRCVDLTGLGYYQAYFFNCPVGTVFDEGLAVCNHPWAAPPCENAAGGQDGASAGADGNDDNLVVVAPSFSFECTAPGFFPHDSDCQRFWLCKGGGDFNALSPELYKCPDGFLFNDSMRRCIREEEVNCEKIPDLARIALEPVPYQLTLDEMTGFFARYRFF